MAEMLVYNAVIVHRDPDLDRKLKALGLAPGERLAVAETFWVLRMDRAREANFLLVHSAGRFVYAAEVVDVERPTLRDLDERPDLAGRVRFITKREIPHFVESLLGTEVPAFLRPRNAKYARLVINNPVSHTATLVPQEQDVLRRYNEDEHACRPIVHAGRSAHAGAVHLADDVQVG